MVGATSAGDCSLPALPRFLVREREGELLSSQAVLGVEGRADRWPSEGVGCGEGGA